jgi:hypothetical protein
VMEPTDRGPPDAVPIGVFPSGFTLWDAVVLLSQPPRR